MQNWKVPSLLHTKQTGDAQDELEGWMTPLSNILSASHAASGVSLGFTGLEGSPLYRYRVVRGYSTLDQLTI